MLCGKFGKNRQACFRLLLHGNKGSFEPKELCIFRKLLPAGREPLRSLRLPVVVEQIRDGEEPPARLQRGAGQRRKMRPGLFPVTQREVRTKFVKVYLA